MLQFRIGVHIVGWRQVQFLVRHSIAAARQEVMAGQYQVRPDLEALRLKAGELLAEFKRVSELILKTKPPE